MAISFHDKVAIVTGRSVGGPVATACRRATIKKRGQAL